MYVCMYSFMYVFMHELIYTYTCMHNLYIYLYRFLQVPTRIGMLCKPYMYVFTCVCMHVFIRMNACMHVRIYVCVWCACVYIYVCICVYICMYIHVPTKEHRRRKCAERGCLTRLESVPIQTYLFLARSLSSSMHTHLSLPLNLSLKRGGGLGSRPKKMYGERLRDGVEYHLMSPTPRR